MCYLQKCLHFIVCICAHARSWRKFAKCRFAHFPSFFSVHVDTYANQERKHTTWMFHDVILVVGCGRSRLEGHLESTHAHRERPGGRPPNDMAHHQLQRHGNGRSARETSARRPLSSVLQHQGLPVRHAGLFASTTTLAKLIVLTIYVFRVLHDYVYEYYLPTLTSLTHLLHVSRWCHEWDSAIVMRPVLVAGNHHHRWLALEGTFSRLCTTSMPTQAYTFFK